mgnify:CR=1 FL=1
MDNNVSVWFDNNDLSSITGLIINDHDFNQLPEKDIKISKIARDDVSIITSVDYVSKDIVVNGIVMQCDRYEAESIMNTLKSFIQLPNKILKVAQYDTIVEYTATLKSISNRWFGNRLIFEIVFLASDPIGRDIESSYIESTVITTGSDSIPFIVGGSYKAKPVISMTVTSVTDGIGASVSLSNTTTNQTITITRDWLADDLLVIDNELKTVRCNGAFIDYSGSFLTFYPGVRALGYADTFTARSVTVSGEYNNKYV